MSYNVITMSKITCSVRARLMYLKAALMLLVRMRKALRYGRTPPNND
jgi:hypothetical protein